MSSGETQNLGLPQYKPTDHPDFLDEINEAYRKIDMAIGSLQASSINEQTIKKLNDNISSLNETVSNLTKIVANRL